MTHSSMAIDFQDEVYFDAGDARLFTVERSMIRMIRLESLWECLKSKCKCTSPVQSPPSTVGPPRILSTFY
jgi:hypothetical protein